MWGGGKIPQVIIGRADCFQHSCCLLHSSQTVVANHILSLGLRLSVSLYCRLTPILSLLSNPYHVQQWIYGHSTYSIVSKSNPTQSLGSYLLCLWAYPCHVFGLILALSLGLSLLCLWAYPCSVYGLILALSLGLSLLCLWASPCSVSWLSLALPLGLSLPCFWAFPCPVSGIILALSLGFPLPCL